MKLRKNENETFVSSSIDNAHDTQQDHIVTKVKVPYFFNVTIRVNIGMHTSGEKKGQPVTATREIIEKEPFPEEWDIVEKKPLTLMFTNKCPKCGEDGNPRINKKNNKDYSHYRASRNKEEQRLAYWHKVPNAKAKACYIASFDTNALFTKTNKIDHSKEVVDYIFPNYLLKDI